MSPSKRPYYYNTDLKHYKLVTLIRKISILMRYKGSNY